MKTGIEELVRRPTLHGAAVVGQCAAVSAIAHHVAEKETLSRSDKH